VVSAYGVFTIYLRDKRNGRPSCGLNIKWEKYQKSCDCSDIWRNGNGNWILYSRVFSFQFGWAAAAEVPFNMLQIAVEGVVSVPFAVIVSAVYPGIWRRVGG
jgi:hypothetical protein